MKEQQIFRLTGFGNLSAIATVLEDGKCWVKYYNGIIEIKDAHEGSVYYDFIESIIDVVNDFCEENGYHLWSY